MLLVEDRIAGPPDSLGRGGRVLQTPTCPDTGSEALASWALTRPARAWVPLWSWAAGSGSSRSLLEVLCWDAAAWDSEPLFSILSDSCKNDHM